VGHRVVSDLVASLQYLADEVWMIQGILPDAEKSGRYRKAIEYFKDDRCALGVRSIVESQAEARRFVAAVSDIAAGRHETIPHRLVKLANSPGEMSPGHFFPMHIDRYANFSLVVNHLRMMVDLPEHKAEVTAGHHNRDGLPRGAMI
jgi:hypothetical protein